VTEAGEGSSISVLDAPELPVQDAAPHDPAEDDLDRAKRAYQQVMGLDRDAAGAMLGVALIEGENGKIDAAEWLLKRSIAIAPTCTGYNILGHYLMRRRQYDAAIQCYRSSLALDPTNLTTWPNLLFALDLHPHASWQLKLAERQAFDAAACKHLTDTAAPHTNDPDPERKLRVGYVSSDFKQHSAAHGFGTAVLGHDRERFEVHLYDVDQSPENADDLIAK
jgi:predicted O-linked N-acetylglucosamine transferase (SPINDLY family)